MGPAKKTVENGCYRDYSYRRRKLRIYSGLKIAADSPAIGDNFLA